MDNIISSDISFVLSNIPLMGLIIALIIATLRCNLTMVKQTGDRLEGFIAYTLLLAVGLSGIWGFIVHAFFPQVADKAIGWASSPFEFEVAVANLGMGVLGIFSFNASRGFRLAAILFTTCFSWGAAAGHIYQMVIKQNFDSGNAGIILYTDMLIPLLLWVFFLAQKKPKTIAP